MSVAASLFSGTALGQQGLRWSRALESHVSLVKGPAVSRTVDAARSCISAGAPGHVALELGVSQRYWALNKNDCMLNQLLRGGNGGKLGEGFTRLRYIN